jgi:hypothetical protein
MLKKEKTSMRIQEYPFLYVETITLEQVQVSPPHIRYNNQRHLKLHKFGKGPFCKFKINHNDNHSGVYALIIGKKVKYIGECQNLRNRFNQGYGNISPRNCYEGGQQTNCHINNEIKNAIKNGNRVLLYFCVCCNDREEIERKLIINKKPCWNL